MNRLGALVLRSSVTSPASLSSTVPRSTATVSALLSQGRSTRGFGTDATVTDAATNPVLTKIGRFNHVAIAVPDLKKATALYRDILGAKVSEPQVWYFVVRYCI